MKQKKKWLPIFLVWIVLGGVGVWGLSRFAGQVYRNSHNYMVEDAICTVMIDPGHGGYDPGAVAADGTMEKDLTLALALKVGAQLHEMDDSIQIMFTRFNDDVLWPDNEVDDLIYRANMAYNAGADYYLSIHMNSSENTTVQGYYGILKEGDAVSENICRSIETYMDQVGWQPALGTRTTADTGSLYVVDNLSIPSLLFETGFMSNAQEVGQMSQSSTLDSIAWAIAQAYYDSIHGLDAQPVTEVYTDES